jgi:hypothetical protein
MISFAAVIITLFLFVIFIPGGTKQKDVVGTIELSDWIDRFEDSKYQVVCWERNGRGGGVFCMDETKLELR